MKKNTLSYKEYVINLVIWTFVIYMIYRNYFFINMSRKTTAMSNLILGLMIILCSALNMMICLQWARNKKSIFASISPPYGIYTYETYKKYLPEVIIYSIVITAIVLALAYIALIAFIKIKSSNKRGILKSKLRNIYIGTRDIFALMCVAIFLVLFSKIFFFGGLITNSHEPYAVLSDEYSFSENVSEIMKLKQETWETLSANEKLEVCQVVANMECRYLGMDKLVPIKASNLEFGINGQYRALDNEIVLSIDHLERSSAVDVTQTIAHECYHAAQFLYKEIYDSLNEEQQNLYFFRDVSQFSKEIENYVDGKNGFERYYYTQDLEQSARRYAISSAEQIFIKIDEYEKQNKNNKVQECGCLNAPANYSKEMEEYMDLSQIGDKKEREIGEVYKNDNPLIKKATTYLEDGTISEVFTYEYDDKNRYLETTQFHLDAANRLMPFIKTRYTYDDSFVYKETTHIQKGNIKTMEVTDGFGNVVVLEGVDENNKIHKDAYTYEYLSDNDLKEEFYCYKGDAAVFEYLKTNFYNDNGLLISSIKQNANDSVEKQTITYEYDQSNRLTKKESLFEENTMLGINDNQYTVEEKFEYLADGRIKKKTTIKRHMSNRNAKEEICYEYEGSRIIKEKRRSVSLYGHMVTREEIKTIKYEY